MQLRYFVSASAVILAGWLTVTFVYEVPSQRYPKLDKYPKSVVLPGNSLPADTVGIEKSAVVRVSHSH